MQKEAATEDRGTDVQLNTYPSPAAPKFSPSLQNSRSEISSSRLNSQTSDLSADESQRTTTHHISNLHHTGEEHGHSANDLSHEAIKWSLLFVDLIFVAIVYNVESVVHTCGGDYYKTYVVAVAYFSVLVAARYQFDFYCCLSICAPALLTAERDDVERALSVDNTDARVFNTNNTAVSISTLSAPPHASTAVSLTRTTAAEVPEIITTGRRRSDLLHAHNVGNNMHIEHLFVNDVFHRIVVFVYLLAVFLMAINIDVDYDHHTQQDELGVYGTCRFRKGYVYGFVMSFFVARTATVIMNLRSILHSPNAKVRKMYKLDVYLRVCMATLSMACFLPVFYRLDLMMTCLPTVGLLEGGGDVLRMLIVQYLRYQDDDSHLFSDNDENVTASSANTSTNIINHLHKLIKVRTRSEVKSQGGTRLFSDAQVLLERLGLVFLLVVGEGILGICYLTYTHFGPKTWVTQVCSFIIIISLAYQFFETVDIFNFDYHALVSHPVIGAIFYTFHILTGFALLVAILAILDLYKESADAYSDDSHHTPQNTSNRQLSFGLFTTEIALLCMRVLHRLVDTEKDISWCAHLRNAYIKFCESCRSRTFVLLVAAYLTSASLHFTLFYITRSEGTSADLIILAHAVVAAFANVAYFVRERREAVRRQEAEEQEHTHSSASHHNFSTAASSGSLLSLSATSDLLRPSNDPLPMELQLRELRESQAVKNGASSGNEGGDMINGGGGTIRGNRAVKSAIHSSRKISY